jgi:hypothetical protein
MESGGIYDKWKLWLELNIEKKREIGENWNKYYKDCWSSESGILFKRAGEALKTGNADIVRACAQRAREIKENNGYTLIKPTTINPDDFSRLMSPYFTLKSKKEEMEAVIEEYKDIYESKKEKSNLGL